MHRQQGRSCCPLHLRPAGIPAPIWRGCCCSTSLQELPPRSNTHGLCGSHLFLYIHLGLPDSLHTNYWMSIIQQKQPPLTNTRGWMQTNTLEDKICVFSYSPTMIQPLSPVVSKTKVWFPGVYMSTGRHWDGRWPWQAEFLFLNFMVNVTFALLKLQISWAFWKLANS